jgi:hypothetical protein
VSKDSEVAPDGSLRLGQFVTADQPYARVLHRVREEAPFEMADIKQISAAGLADTAHRVADALGL